MGIDTIYTQDWEGRVLPRQSCAAPAGEKEVRRKECLAGVGLSHSSDFNL